MSSARSTRPPPVISAEHWFRLIAAHFTATASTLILAECSALFRQVVWERGTKFAGGNEATGAKYDLVQVMDAQGNKLQPAYDANTNAAIDTYCKHQGPPACQAALLHATLQRVTCCGAECAAQACRDDVLRRTLTRIGAPTELHVVQNADQRFKVLKKSGRTPEEVSQEMLGIVDGWIEKVLGD